MKRNDIIHMTCEAIGADMEGICRPDGIAVFVPGMLPGESADVRIVKPEKRYAFGKMEGDVQNRSPQRRDPCCDAYPRCGGCSCRHMTYSATLEYKRRQVEDCFMRIGGIQVSVPPVLGMDVPHGYRNKTALPVGGTKQEPVMGFYAPRSHHIIPAEGCTNAMAPSADLSRAFLAWMRDHAVAPYDEKTHTGLVRHLVIRVNRIHQAMVTVVINGRELPHVQDLIARLQPLGMQSLIVNENRDQTNVIMGKKFRTLFGPDELQDVLCGLKFSLSPAAFFQVNPEQTEKLYRTALEFADLKEDDTLCDVYCGAGTISLLMAGHCRKVLGIEVVPQAIENAKLNAKRNNISHADFIAGAAEDVLPRLVQGGMKVDVIVVDPPRKGLQESVIRAIAAARPRRVVYVSCNVATQARDAALLTACGYQLDRIQPVDMFCWTSGVENVASFTLQGN